MAHGTKYSDEELARMAELFQRGEIDLVGEPELIESERVGGTAVLSVRLPRNVLAQLKVAAGQEGIGATVLARNLIIAGLAAEPNRLAGAVPVAQLLQLIIAYGYVEPPDTRSPAELDTKVSAPAASKRRTKSVQQAPKTTAGQSAKGATETTSRRQPARKAAASIGRRQPAKKTAAAAHSRRRVP